MLDSITLELQMQHEKMDALSILLNLCELYDTHLRAKRYKVSNVLYGCALAE